MMGDLDWEWQDISTVPRDGRYVLLCRALDADNKPITGHAWGIFVQVAAWWKDEGDDGEWIVYCSLISEPRLHFDPTHWADLPTNPLTGTR